MPGATLRQSNATSRLAAPHVLSHQIYSIFIVFKLITYDLRKSVYVLKIPKGNILISSEYRYKEKKTKLQKQLFSVDASSIRRTCDGKLKTDFLCKSETPRNLYKRGM